MIHNGIESAAAPSGGLAELQSLVWVNQCIAMTGSTPQARRRPSESRLRQGPGSAGLGLPSTNAAGDHSDRNACSAGKP